MAATPKLKVYNKDGEYLAACKHGEDAACLVAMYGNGATIRHEHSRIVWIEGDEAQLAGESYDFVAETIAARIETNTYRRV